MDLQHAVREVVTSIPAGRVASYGDVGNRIGVGPRQVGRAMSLLDDSLPWWRVVHADGTPATCHGGQATRLLVVEGTPMRAARVNMDRARWHWDRKGSADSAVGEQAGAAGTGAGRPSPAREEGNEK